MSGGNGRGRVVELGLYYWWWWKLGSFKVRVFDSGVLEFPEWFEGVERCIEETGGWVHLALRKYRDGRVERFVALIGDIRRCLKHLPKEMRRRYRELGSPYMPTPDPFP